MASLKEILKRRDERASKRRELLEKYQNTIITFHLNIPGETKDKLLYKVSLIEGVNQLKEMLKINDVKIFFDSIDFLITGPEAVLVVDGQSTHLKNMMLEFEEEHPLGRYFDLDVFDDTGKQISRNDLGLSERKCYVCDDLAKVCARSKRHSIDVIIASIEENMTNYHLNSH